MFTDYYTFLEIDQQVLIFKVGDTDVAVELKYVRKVELVEEIMPLPRSPAGVEGIIRIDEEPYPMLRLEHLLGLSGEESEFTIVVLLNAIESVYALHLPGLPIAIERVDGEEVKCNIPKEWILSYVSAGSSSIPVLNPTAIWNGIGVN